MNKTLKTLFTLSIALNVLLLGAGGGMVLKEWREKDRWHMAKVEMSPASRAMVAARYEKMHKDMEPLFDEMQKSRERMKVIMVQEKFDGARFDEIAKHLRSLRLQMGDQMSAVTKDMISAMPAEERRKMAERFLYGFGFDKQKLRGQQTSRWHCTRETFGPMRTGDARAGNDDMPPQPQPVSAPPLPAQ